jgi:metacaspase-1
MPRVLFVHGVSHVEVADPDWVNEWLGVVAPEMPGTNVVPGHVDYDDLFDFPLSAATIARAMWELTKSGVNSELSKLGNRLGGLFGRRRDLLGNLTNLVGWTAGMVVQWAGDPDLRKRCRDRVRAAMTQFQPDVVCAHSLGSLICYDTFVQPECRDSIEGKVFVTLGSQIGNDFVTGTFAGRIDLPQARAWYHFFNAHDWVFTAPLEPPSANFLQVETDFTDPPLNHNALKYLGHPNARAQAWAALAGPAPRRALTLGVKASAQAQASDRRALLVGINEYPDPANRLAGCVNDVYLMSAVLQERGFQPDDIRVVLDERATAEGIRQRLQWLLDDVRAGDERFFFYSGHGAQLPGYGFEGKPDRLHSCLVPCDFAWTGETAITDDQFDNYYSQLPYEARFIIVLDCCYSGGMVRAGGARVRGLDPPDDVRHRMLRWDWEREMWLPRELVLPNPDLAEQPDSAAYVGRSGAERRLGRAIGLRTLPQREYNRVRRRLGHEGPYLPLIYEACQADQFSYEYEHGVTSYGAFTYTLSRVLRQYRTAARPITFTQLLNEARTTLHDLNYDQVPTLLGPGEWLNKPIPWAPASGTPAAGGRGERDGRTKRARPRIRR